MHNISSCWPSSTPIQALPVTPHQRIKTLERTLERRVDILQVTRYVDCVVRENVKSVHRLATRPFLHVIVTPDVKPCYALRKFWHHIRCRSDDDVLTNIDLHTVQSILSTIGPNARAKGPMWFFQQMLKLGAVAHGIEGLSEYVRVMDGETLLFKPFDWFTRNGDEIFDVCDTWSAKEVGDGWNHERYGALYYKLTGKALIGSPALVSHGMSMKRTNVRSLLDALSPPGASWKTNMWISNSLNGLCDEAAITGFSEYFYYASWVLSDHNKTSAVVRMLPSTCRRVKSSSTHTCNAAFIKTLARHSGKYAYIVMENHASRHKQQKSKLKILRAATNS